MKTRITAFMLMMAMLLSLLSGCGGTAPEPETNAAPKTEAPITEPVTEPTEPPTVLEQMGYGLWENASGVSELGGINWYGVDLPISRGLNGEYQEYRTYFYFEDYDGGILEDLVDAPVDVQIYEFPASSFDDDIDWMQEKLKPFYQYCKKQESSDVSFKEWVNTNQDKKLLWMESRIQVDGIELHDEALGKGFAVSKWGVNVWGPGIVNPITGKRFSATNNYDFDTPVVGQWKLDVKGKNAEVLALMTRSVSDWHGMYREKINWIWDVYILLPAEIEDICFSMPEFTSVEAYKEATAEEPETDALWETGNILEDYDTEKHNYYFYSLYSKPE